MATITERFGFTKPAGSDPASIVPLNSNTDLIEQYLGRTQDMIAPMYDDTDTYDVGDIVTYESNLYKCITAISTAETFDPTKWEATTAVEEGSGGGGGSSVIPNPTGTPTDTLSTVSIDGTIYNIEGSGGGSGSGYTETTLWSGSETPSGSTGVDLSLSEAIDNYDLITIYASDGGNSGSIIYPVSALIDGTDKLGCIYGAGNASINIWMALTNTSTLNVKKAISNVNVTYTKIVGMKYVSGGGGTSEGEGVEIYSEGEYIVGKWIDGKKLYQKTIKFSATSLPASWTTIEQNVDYNLAFPEVQGLYYTSNGEPFTQSTRVFVQNGDLKIQPLNELDLLSSTLKHVITIRYTKTVETPAPAWGGSVSNYYANFIDTDNVIDSGTYTGTFTYIATEDCYVNVALINDSNSDAQITIDGAVINYTWSTNGITNYQTLPLKKGQTLVATSSACNALDYTVYGITYASGGSSSGSKIEYSTEEKEVGTWIDGSKVYKKTVTLGSMPAQGNTKSVNHSIENLGLVIEASIIVKNTSNIQYPVPMVSRLSTGDQTTYYISQTAVTVVNGNNSSIDETASGYAVLTYTKAVS